MFFDVCRSQRYQFSSKEFRCAGVLYPPLFRNGIRVREYQRSLVRNKANRRRYVLVRGGARILIAVEPWHDIRWRNLLARKRQRTPTRKIS